MVRRQLVESALLALSLTVAANGDFLETVSAVTSHK